MGINAHQQTGSISVPIWLARALVPAALLVAMGSSFNLWRGYAVMEQRGIERDRRIENLAAAFVEFRSPGDRFTARDGERMAGRLDLITQRLGGLERKSAEVDVRIGFINDHIKSRH